MVSIRKVEAVLTAMNDGQATGLKGRLQYLNLQGFPPGLRIGKAKRADYGIDELLAYSLWFALTKASTTPQTAIALIVDFWPEFARMFLASARAAGINGIRATLPAATIAVVTGDALRSPSKATPDDLGGPARSFNIVAASPESLSRALPDRPGVATIITLDSVYSDLATALAGEPYPLDAAALTRELTAFGAREGWTSAPRGEAPVPTPTVQPQEFKARGERLSEIDYYYGRALELIENLENRVERCHAGPRLHRLARYLLEPSPREGWKRWMAVGDTDVNFVFGMAALIGATTMIETGIPETLQIEAAFRIAGADFEPADLASKLRATASAARDLELDMVSAGQPWD